MDHFTRIPIAHFTGRHPRRFLLDNAAARGMIYAEDAGEWRLGGLGTTARCGEDVCRITPRLGANVAGAQSPGGTPCPAAGGRRQDGSDRRPQFDLFASSLAFSTFCASRRFGIYAGSQPTRMPVARGEGELRGGRLSLSVVRLGARCIASRPWKAARSWFQQGLWRPPTPDPRPSTTHD